MTPNHPKWRFIVPPFKKLGSDPPPKGGGSLGKQYYYWFFGGPWPPLLGAIFTVIPFKILFLMIKWPFLNGVTMKMTPLRVNFHCNTIQNIVFNDQMIIFEWFYNENDPLGGSIFTVMPFKNIVFNDQRPFFEWCYNENDPPRGGQNDPFWGGSPIQWVYRPPKNVKNERFLRAPKVGIGRNRNGLHRKSWKQRFGHFLHEF